MNRERYVRLRRSDWKDFELLLAKLQKSRDGKWTAAEVSLMARLYRSVCFDLSMVQSREWGTQLEEYLNSLVASGHNFLYRSPQGQALPSLSFLLIGFPQLLRSQIRPFLLALALFGVPLVVCTILAAVRPDLAEYLVDREVLEQAKKMYSTSLYTSESPEFLGQRSYMFGFYVNNNVGIAFRAFSLGALAGIGTGLVLLSNGINIGLVQGCMLAEGGDTANNFFSFVITHGSFELTAIVIAGAAGLILARGIVFPETRTRLESLQHHGRIALRLALGAGAMLVVAAVIEGYFSPAPIGSGIKYFTGTLAWITVIAWLSLAGRGRVSQ